MMQEESGSPIKDARMPEKVKELPKEPLRGGLLKRTLRELEMLDIKIKDLFSFGEGNVSLNLSWNKVINLVNYNAGEKVLSIDDVFGDSIDILARFLV